VSSDPASNEKRRNELRRKTRKQQPKLSTDSLLKTSKRGAVELSEQELGKVSGGDAVAGDLSKVSHIHFTTTTKDKTSTFLSY
jgi:hypothetical protein